MGAQKGKDLLLKLDFDQDGNFETVAGLRAKRISFDARSVDVTNADSAGRWRELLEGAGVRRAGATCHPAAASGRGPTSRSPTAPRRWWPTTGCSRPRSSAPGWCGASPSTTSPAT